MQQRRDQPASSTEERRSFFSEKRASFSFADCLIACLATLLLGSHVGKGMEQDDDS
jgi:hypothetical protein